MDLVVDMWLFAGVVHAHVLKSRVDLGFGKAYTRRIGHCATLAMTMHRFIHVARLEPGEEFGAWRHGVVSVLTYQGAERLLAGCPLVIHGDVTNVQVVVDMFAIGDARDFTDLAVVRQSFMPRALWIPGHMRLFYNRLVEAVCGLSLIWKAIEKTWRLLCGFFNTGLARQDS